MIDVLPGIYTLTVTTPGGDTLTSSAEILLLNDLFPTFELTAYSCWDTCYGGILHFMTDLGMDTAYTVTLDPPAGYAAAIPGQLMLTDLCLGTEYTATITRSDGCQGFIGPITVEGPEVPILLSTTTTPSCAGGATGSVTLVFDELPIQIGVYSADTSISPLVPSSNPVTIQNLPPGEYTGWATSDFLGIPLDQGCSLFFNFEISPGTDPCGQLSGTAFVDVDEDCMYDAEEAGLPYKIFSVEPGEHLFITDGSGNFSTEYPSGTYSLNTTFTDYTSDCTLLPYEFIFDMSSMNEVIVLPFASEFDPDVSVLVSAGTHVPGFPVNYHVTVSNQGPPFNFNGITVDLMFDPLLVPGFVEGSPVLIAPGHYQWTGLDLPPFSSIQYELEFTVPPDAGLIGTMLTATASVSDNTEDEDQTNDTYSITHTIMGSFDPNDKLVQTSSQLAEGFYFIDVDEWMDYTIRFQNTGNAAAINVVLIDTIPSELDLASLEILGSSHTFTPSIEAGRALRFEFPGIMLPDSTSNFAGSQGFVSFRLKPVAEIDLMLGSIISNEADIFFDFNEPIRTNAAELEVTITVGVPDQGREEVGIHPNPADKTVELKLPVGNWDLQMLGVDGRIVRSINNIADRQILTLDGMAPGHYAIRAMNNEGKSITGRFVKQ